MEEGGGRIEDTTLFGKYQLCRVLGRGRSGTVYLAKHIDLEEYRAIKQVPKACVGYEQFRREALILKSIRHPGIPVVYDLEEDEEFSYLIEEFLEGDSLYALVSDMGHFSKAMTVRYGIQICRLVSILHSSRPIPILYLDLQPKNLLVCHDTVKLVDFDHAVHLDEAEHLTKRYGTIGCAAPEQYTGEILDERTDIYAIGAVLYYMLTGTFPDGSPVYRRELIGRDLADVIRRCLDRDPKLRYESADRLCEELERIQEKMAEKRQGVFRNDHLSSLTIAVAGAAPGAGATHVAIGLAMYLRRCGLSVLYEEKNGSGAVRQFASCAGAVCDRYGIYRICGLPMLPSYGEAVKLEPHPFGIVVQDCGVLSPSFSQTPADGYLLVCGAKPWQWEMARDAVSISGALSETAVIYNHFCRQLKMRLPCPAREANCFLMPQCSNPFASAKQMQKFYHEVFLTLTGQRTGGIVRRLYGVIERLRKGPGGRWGS